MVHVDFDCLFGKGGTSVSGFPALVKVPKYRLQLDSTLRPAFLRL